MTSRLVTVEQQHHKECRVVEPPIFLALLFWDTQFTSITSEERVWPATNLEDP